MPRSGSERPVKPRRLSKEDKLRLELLLSDRHRQWGFDTPMVNVDFLCVRYDGEVPVAIIEYKHFEAEFQEDSNLRALQKLYVRQPDGSYIRCPLFVVSWQEDFRAWQITDGYSVEKVVAWFPSEPQYVQWLYSLAGRTVPEKVVARLEQHDRSSM